MVWPTTTSLLHQSGFHKTQMVPAGPVCSVNPSITPLKAILILHHKFSPQKSPHSVPLFIQPPFSLSLSPSLCFHSHLFLYHFLPLYHPAVYPFSQHTLFFFLSSACFLLCKSAKKLAVKFFLGQRTLSEQMQPLCCPTHCMTHTHTHTPCHWVHWPCGIASWNACISNHYMQFHYIPNRRISKPLSLWALLYLPPPIHLPIHVHVLSFIQVSSARVWRIQVLALLYLCQSALLLHSITALGIKTMCTDCKLIKLVVNYDGRAYLTDLCDLLV